MKMEWNFEKSQESASFSLENKARIDRDFHFRLFELVSKNIAAFGGPKSMKVSIFYTRNPDPRAIPPLFAPEDRFREQKQGGGILRREVEQPPPFRSGSQTLAFLIQGGGLLSNLWYWF